MKTKSLKFTLDLIVEIDGAEPSDEKLNDIISDAVIDSIPGVLLDSDELDCALFTSSVGIEPIK